MFVFGLESQYFSVKTLLMIEMRLKKSWVFSSKKGLLVDPGGGRKSQKKKGRPFWIPLRTHPENRDFVFIVLLFVFLFVFFICIIIIIIYYYFFNFPFHSF